MMEDLRVINGILNGKEVPIGQGHMTQSQKMVSTISSNNITNQKRQNPSWNDPSSKRVQTPYDSSSTKANSHAINVDGKTESKVSSNINDVSKDEEESKDEDEQTMMDQQQQAENPGEESQMYLTAQLLLRNNSPRQNRRMISDSHDSVSLWQNERRHRYSTNIQFQDFIYG